MGQVVEDDFEKEIVRTVDRLNSRMEVVSFTDIYEELDCPKSTLSKKINGLKEEGFIVDRDWKDNSSRYEVVDEVSIDVDYRFEEFLSTRLIINIIQILSAGFMLYYFELGMLYLMFFLVGFLPAFGYTVAQVLLDDEFYRLSVQKQGS